MPYIKQERRDPAWEAGPLNSGELNYVITSMCEAYLGLHGNHYIVFNDIIGALEGAKMEFYRRIAAPYEDKKIKENGDVYYVKEEEEPSREGVEL